MAKKEKKPGKGKRALITIGIICAAIVVLVGILTVITAVGTKATFNKIGSFEAVEYENQLVPEKDEDGDWTFTTDKELKVVQLTDVHLGGGWLSVKKDSMAINAVAAMVSAEKPDLVIVTGDIGFPVPYAAGTFNNITPAKEFAALMDQLGVYWTMAMGNHDTESYSYAPREKIGNLYENGGYKYSLFQMGDVNVDGTGNQIIKVKNSDGIITQALYTFDSHSYTDGDILGIQWKYDNIHENQVQWYADTIKKMNDENNAIYKKNGEKEDSDIKSLAFFHIPLVEVKEAWDEYVENGYKDNDDINMIYGVAGETGKVVFCGMHEDELFETMQELGSTKGIFFGHDHYNNFSMDYKGIRFTYGKSIDYLAYSGIYKVGSQRGCTVITVNPDGSFDCNAESYYQDKYITLYEKEDVTMQEVTYVNE